MNGLPTVNYNALKDVIGSHVYCFACDQQLPVEEYSTTQLTKYSSNRMILDKDTSGKTIKFKPMCKECCCDQVKDIKCVTCSQYKPLEEFSKAQRRMAGKASGARCLKCIRLRDDLDWVAPQNQMRTFKEEEPNGARWSALPDGHPDNIYDSRNYEFDPP
ncbi:hypothetical protein SeMB42_g02671 [Synchytrium endobioticum]|uniref:Stc1 domain-containing protein n=1 Tax=Synchytrium endobioticum TaxID=286115 RepID=A0A507DC66_9FUNG|nr:hypothetical protein SeLEV6574_g02117 [Synchytrium endobioticum]TPX49279.1 hypothetical protein SeMB42_g02671 [Synchytrium endobioticum]